MEIANLSPMPVHVLLNSYKVNDTALGTLTMVEI